MDTYKDQFTEWSPAYPVVFHSFMFETEERVILSIKSKRRQNLIMSKTLKTHNITINAINKAMKK